MFICLLKAHPWVLTPTSSTAKRNISSRRRRYAICVCERECEWGGESWGSSSLHQMRLSAGTLLSQTGTHLPMVSCEVLGERTNKGAKRLCDNEGAPRRAFKCGTQAARDKLCQSLLNYFFVLSRGLLGAFMDRRKDMSSHGERSCRSARCFVYRGDPKLIIAEM